MLVSACFEISEDGHISPHFFTNTESFAHQATQLQSASRVGMICVTTVIA